jgi:hypothetical protein
VIGSTANDLRPYLWRYSVVASFVGPALAAVVAIVGITLTLDADRQARQEEASRQAEAELQLAIAQNGSVICDFTAGRDASSSFDADYLESFDDLCKRWIETSPPDIRVQRELVAQLAANPKQREEILAMWRAIYDADDWIGDIEAATPGG